MEKIDMCYFIEKAPIVFKSGNFCWVGKNFSGILQMLGCRWCKKFVVDDFCENDQLGKDMAFSPKFGRET